MSFAGLRKAAVSTHSRPKAAGVRVRVIGIVWQRFQHTAARRRLGVDVGDGVDCGVVSTHSRPKAAGVEPPIQQVLESDVSTHSRPKAAGCRSTPGNTRPNVSTHSRPKAAGASCCATKARCKKFQHTAARRRLASCKTQRAAQKKFQHTAARRRLAEKLTVIGANAMVSTHSRPKAAGTKARRHTTTANCFNTQPPEGGWERHVYQLFSQNGRFNTQPPEGGWASCCATKARCKKFQHTAARRRLADDHADPSRHERVSTHSRPKAAGKD